MQANFESLFHWKRLPLGGRLAIPTLCNELHNNLQKISSLFSFLVVPWSSMAVVWKALRICLGKVTAQRVPTSVCEIDLRRTHHFPLKLSKQLAWSQFTQEKPLGFCLRLFLAFSMAI